jgi:Fe-S-cluster containining protein
MHSDPDRPGTWRKFKPGLCDSCTAGCCFQVLEVSLDELVSMKVIDEDVARIYEPKRIVRDFSRWIEKYTSKTNKFTINRLVDGRCIFLNQSNRCTIYEHRPKTCRDYPFPSSRPGFCPYKNKSGKV